MAKVTGKSIVNRGVYEAEELMGRNMVSLKLVRVEAEPKQDVIKVEISQALARRVGQLKQPGETLKQAVERLLDVGCRAS